MWVGEYRVFGALSESLVLCQSLGGWASTESASLGWASTEDGFRLFISVEKFNSYIIDVMLGFRDFTKDFIAWKCTRTTVTNCIIKNVVFFCAALAAVSASLIGAPLVNTGVSARAQTQDALGNYAFQYNIVDGATGSLNSRAEVGKVGIAAGPIAVAAPAIAAPLTLVAPSAIGGVIGYGAAPLAVGGVLGHGATLGLGYGAGILGAGIGKLI
ncbi:uncharacterized protein NPIL_643341 [Nephila pilipes]|uniref:Uncharacterized protein n=1 Tax=Nephila pilipes TaxID=299642 RepID=A0A8X6NKL9_NEPPI|nr:uncharacterized protein NPIL_643341 [Nephila pilipes]